jgi:PLD-like domain
MKVKTPMSSIILKAILQGILVCTALASHAVSLPATGTIEVAFSPKEGAEELIVRVIDSAQSEIKMLAYSFTSSPVVAALLRAHKRGVKVSLVADKSLKNLPQHRHREGKVKTDHPVQHGQFAVLLGQFVFNSANVVFGGRMVIQGIRQRLAQRLRFRSGLRIRYARSLQAVNIFQGIKSDCAHVFDSRPAR